jgi:hypothetical protein
MPLPRELATPPVTKMCFVTGPQHTSRVRRRRGPVVVNLGLTTTGRQCEIDSVNLEELIAAVEETEGPLDRVSAAPARPPSSATAA